MTEDEAQAKKADDIVIHVEVTIPDGVFTARTRRVPMPDSRSKVAPLVGFTVALLGSETNEWLYDQYRSDVDT